MNLPPYLSPVNILDADANEQIKRAGELARSMIAFTMICEEHGEFAWEIQEKHLERTEEHHRNKERCYHKIEVI